MCGEFSFRRTEFEVPPGDIEQAEYVQVWSTGERSRLEERDLGILSLGQLTWERI